MFCRLCPPLAFPTQVLRAPHLRASFESKAIDRISSCFFSFFPFPPTFLFTHPILSHFFLCIMIYPLPNTQFIYFRIKDTKRPVLNVPSSFSQSGHSGTSSTLLFPCVSSRPGNNLSSAFNASSLFYPFFLQEYHNLCSLFPLQHIFIPAGLHVSLFTDSFPSQLVYIPSPFLHIEPTPPFPCWRFPSFDKWVTLSCIAPSSNFKASSCCPPFPIFISDLANLLSVVFL